MNRTQFTFYESFYKALSRIRRASDRAKAYDLMVRFALYGEEPDLEQTEAERKQEQEQGKEKEQVREEVKVKEKDKERVRDQDRDGEEARGKEREKESPLPSYYPDRVREERADALLMETWNRQRRSWGLGS